jgi:hypothetical protein
MSDGDVERAADRTVLLSPDGRWAIVSRAGLVADFQPMGSVEDLFSAMSRRLGGLPWQSEADVRAELARDGLTSPAIDELLDRARRHFAMVSSQPLIMERITKIGYRNADGQEVVRRTERQVRGQRVFMMRCSVCAHEYATYGCDADIRRCPRCQENPPSLNMR